MDQENAVQELTYASAQLAGSLVRQNERYSIPCNWGQASREIRVKIEQTRLGTEWETDVKVYSKSDHWHVLETLAKSLIHQWAGRHGPLQTWSPDMTKAAIIILDTIDAKQRKIMRRNWYYPHHTRLNIMIESYFHFIN